MGMSGSGLKSAIQSAVPIPSGFDDTKMTAICNAIINYIVQNAAVSATIPASSIVTVGSPSTQTGPAAPVGISGTIS